MLIYSLEKLLCGIDWVSDSDVSGVRVSGVRANSKDIGRGDAFVCMKGCLRDGADYITEALERGAMVVICDKSCKRCNKNAIFVRVSDIRSAYAKLCSAVCGDPSRGMRMIGVTGTNGKTTVVNMIAAALRKSGRRVATVGTLGVSFEGSGTLADGMTTPDPEVLYPLLAELKEKGAQDVVMEASSHALELCKLDAVAFDLGAITNMSAEHLDFHGNMDRYYHAKKKLMEKSKKAVFLTDDYYTSKMYSETDGKKRVSCSCTKNDADCTVREVSCNFRDGVSFTAVKNGKAITVKSPIPAFFTVSNALLAYTALCELGVSEEDITEGIASLQSVDGRMERIETGLDFSIYVDFAHTPDALSALLKAVRHMKGPEGRIVTLFGCGGDRDKGKRSLMGAVASRLSDMVILTSDNCRSEKASDIIDMVMLGFDKSCPYVRIEDRAKAIRYALSIAEKGDVILLCGKGHERYEIQGSDKTPFSERDIVISELQARKRGDGKSEA